MDKYLFIARSPTGKKVKGRIEINSVEELNQVMIYHNYQLLSYKKLKNKSKIIIFTHITKNDLLNFSENLYLMLKAGINLKKALDLCSDATSKSKFKIIIKELGKEIEKGKPISLVLRSYQNVFPTYFWTMFSLSERSGNLLNVLKHLIETYRFEINLGKKIRNSMFYPSLLLILSFVIIIVISTVIIPTFVVVFEQMKVELPLITKMMINISNFISKNLFIIFLSVLLIIFGFICIFKTKKGKYFFDKIKLKLPIIKKIYILNLSSKMCRTLAILIDSGIPTISSLQTTAFLTNNEYVKERFNFVIDEVKRGLEISQALYFLEFLPQVVIETTKVSEQTASLATSLDNLANLFNEEEHTRLQKLVTIIEPLFILIIALVVVILVVAIFIPLFSMLDNIGEF